MMPGDVWFGQPGSQAHGEPRAFRRRASRRPALSARLLPLEDAAICGHADRERWPWQRNHRGAGLFVSSPAKITKTKENNYASSSHSTSNIPLDMYS